MSLARHYPVFSAVFVIAYAVSAFFNLAPFTYYPLLREFHYYDQPATAGPPMYWYGWLVTSTIAAVGIVLIRGLLPRRAGDRGRSGWSWIIPVAVILFLVWFSRNWFIK